MSYTSLESPPSVDKFPCISASFMRGDGTDAEPLRRCTAYWRDHGHDLELLAVVDPAVGIDPARFPPERFEKGEHTP